MKWRLDVQVMEKKAREQGERQANDNYYKSVVERVHNEEAIEREKREGTLKKRIEFKNNLLLQMGQVARDGGSSVSPSSVAGGLTNRRRIPMEAMTSEELRINK